MSLRDSILDTPDIPTEIVDVPEWHVKIEVRGMSLAKREEVSQVAVDQMAAREKGGVTESSFNAATVIECAYDPESGEPIFTQKDGPALMQKAAAPIMRIAEVAQRLSGLTDESVKEAGKDLPSIHDDDSSMN